MHEASCYSSCQYNNVLMYMTRDFTIILYHYILEFGFAQSSIVGTESGEAYTVDMGVLEGRNDQQVEVTIEVILHTARKL